MIPVTSFAGKSVAVFGLGGSGRATALALAAGGATVAAWDDNAERGRRGARPRASPIDDLRDADWRALRRAGAGARRAAHPSRAALDGGAGAGRRHRGHRRHRAVLPRAPAPCARRAVRRHHRHQRQVDDHGADRPSARARPAATSQLGGNIGTAILSLEPPARGRIHVVECSSFQIDLAPRLDPSSACCSTSRPTISTGTARSSTTPRSRSGWSPAPATAVIARRRPTGAQAIADRLAARRQARRPRLRRGGRSPTASMPTAASIVARRATAPRRGSPILAGIGSLRGAHNAQNAAAAVAVVPRARPRPTRDRRRACRAFPACRTAWKRSAGAAACSSSTIPRRPTPMPRRRRWRASTASTGSPAAGRRRAASRRSTDSSRASPRPT